MKGRLKEKLQRELQRMTRRELAQRIGLPATSVYNYLYTDTQPSMPVLEKMARYFGTTVADLLRDEEEATEQVSVSDPELVRLVQTVRALDDEGRRMVYSAAERERLFAQLRQKAKGGREPDGGEAELPSPDGHRVP